MIQFCGQDVVVEKSFRARYAHEFCHSLHPDHSKAFWDEAERIYPEYKEHRELLHAYNLDWLFERAKLGKLSF